VASPSKDIKPSESNLVLLVSLPINADPVVIPFGKFVKVIINSYN
jgi:hypothetical protein